MWKPASLAVMGLVVTLAIGGCAQEEPTIEPDTEGSPATQAPTATPAQTPETQPQTSTVQMNALNNSGQTGTATLTAVDGTKTKVLVELSGSPGGSQPAHIHSGTCSKLGGVEYPLTSLENGRSESTVDAPLDTLLADQFAVNVHKSSAAISVYASCGEIGQ
jgi:hypothetical protein